jgi:hypothetical protein
MRLWKVRVVLTQGPQQVHGGGRGQRVCGSRILDRRHEQVRLLGRQRHRDDYEKWSRPTTLFLAVTVVAGLFTSSSLAGVGWESDWFSGRAGSGLGTRGWIIGMSRGPTAVTGRSTGDHLHARHSRFPRPGS